MNLLNILFFSVIIACKSSPKEGVEFEKRSSGVITQETLNFTDTLSRPDLHYQKITKQLGLKFLSDTNLYEEYRIWLEDASQISNILIVLRKHGDGWGGDKYIYRANLNEDFEITSLEFTSKKAEPKSNNRLFESKIKDLRTYHFRNAEDIDGYDFCMGNYGLILESQKSLEYSKFLYPCWSAIDKIKDVDILSNFFKICMEEFGFTFYDKVYEKLKS